MLLWAFFYRRIAMKTRTIVCLLVLLFGVNQANGLVQFKDGLVHVIDYTINDDVWVDYQAPGMQTTVNLFTGGEIIFAEQSVLKGFNDSRLNISGGHVDYLFAYDNSHVTISNGGANYLRLYDNSHMIMSGGSIWGMTAGGNSQVVILGGNIGHGLALKNNANVIINGSDFAIDGSPVGFGEITSVFGGDIYDEPPRMLTYTPTTSEFGMCQFGIGETASINLVPEPGTIVLLVTGLIAGGFLLRRK